MLSQIRAIARRDVGEGLTEGARILAAVPLPAVLVGQNARVGVVNPPGEGLFGRGLVGRGYVAAFRHPVIVEAIEGALAGAARRECYAVPNAAGESLWRVTAMPIDGGALACFEDVTTLEEAARMRRDFVANVSHELRTPLTAITGFIETLRGPARDDPAARERFLGIMAREAGRMSRLVEDLLSLSRVEAQGRARPIGRADLREAALAAAQALRRRAEEAGTSIELALPEGPVEIRGDADQIQQVLANLIENAIKYGGARGPVRVALTAPVPAPRLRGPAARIDVTDAGEGIDAIHLPRLGERFYRADAHRGREAGGTALGGTGLGLAIVKHIVARHRGRLEIESAPGEGSRFSVLLPIE